MIIKNQIKATVSSGQCDCYIKSVVDFILMRFSNRIAETIVDFKNWSLDINKSLDIDYK